MSPTNTTATGRVEAEAAQNSEIPAQKSAPVKTVRFGSRFCRVETPTTPMATPNPRAVVNRP